MYLNKGNSYVSWSRHVGILQETDQVANGEEYVVARARRHLHKIKAASKSSGMRVDPRKTTSDSSLWKSGSGEWSKGESWDSQSDPGSISTGMWKTGGYPRRLNGEGGQIDNRKFGNKCKVRGRGESPRCKQRRKQGTQRDDQGGGQEDFWVQMPEGAPAQVIGTCEQGPQYVHSYFEFMYYCCVSSYKWDEKEEEVEQTKRQYALCIIQKAITLYIAILATFSSFITIKLELVSFLDERTLSQFIDIGYFLVSCAIHWNFTYFFTFQHTAISETLKTWQEYECSNTQKTFGNKYPTVWLPIINGVLTVMMAILKTILYTDFDSWSVEGLLLANSEEVSYGFLAWKPDHLNNSTLSEEFGSQLNTSSYLMGTLGLMGNFCWYLQIGCFKDALFWVAVLNKHHVVKFGKRIRDNTLRKKMTGKNVSEDDDECWQAYRQILEVNSLTNSTYNTMFMINHLDSFLVFSYWLTELLNEQVKLRVLIFIGYSVVKGILAYFPARITSGENDECRDWIQTLPCQTGRFLVGDTPFTREVMLMELERKPLGLGKGRVHINNEFLVSFVTLVASLFCFLLNLKPKNEEETRY